MKDESAIQHRERVRIEPDLLADLLDEIHDDGESAPDEIPLWRKRFER